MLDQANRSPFAASLTGWSDHGHGSLAQRLAFGIRRLIDAGLVPSGSYLPPERRLADELAVSRSTVTAALDQLRADGVIASRQGRGTVVIGPPVADLASNRVADSFVLGAGGVDLAIGNPADVSHLPAVSVDIADLLASGVGAAFQPLGLPALRQALAERYRRHGLHTDADEIHITSGAHQAVALATSVLVTKREPVAFEVPNYPGVFDILEGIGASVVPLETDRGGVRPESLERALGEHGAKVVYVQSGPQNPTGFVQRPARLRALAAVLDRYEATVVEDAALAALTYDGAPETDLARLCRRTTVVSVGSFSKVLWGGFRVGWLRAPVPIVDRTLYRRLALDLGPAVPSQLLCLALLPHMDDVADRRRQFLFGNVARAADLLAAEVPEWRIPHPDGGSVLWVEVPVDDSGPLVQFARRHGVHIAAGSISVVGQHPDPHVRICVDRPWDLVEIGLRRLVAAWRELSRRPARIAG